MGAAIIYAVQNFNSHAHVERDEHIGHGTDTTIISTHTLTWSVTRSPGVNVSTADYFNSHAHVERDDNRGEPRRNLCNFNSHAHVERDLMVEDDRLWEKFQLTRSRGA